MQGRWRYARCVEPKRSDTLSDEGQRPNVKEKRKLESRVQRQVARTVRRGAGRKGRLTDLARCLPYTMPATCLADHDFLAIPAGRHRARGNTSCYWRQLSLDMRGEVKWPCPLQAGRTAMAVGQAPLNARPQRPTAGTMGARPTRTLGLAQASRCPRPLENISVV